MEIHLVQEVTNRISENLLYQTNLRLTYLCHPRNMTQKELQILIYITTVLMKLQTYHFSLLI